jgi:hypothetical protein
VPSPGGPRLVTHACIVDARRRAVGGTGQASARSAARVAQLGMASIWSMTIVRACA